MFHRSAAAAASVVWAASGVVIGTAVPARAHAELKSVTPGQRSVQTTAPAEVELTFNQPVNGRFTTVRVTGPAGARAEDGRPAVERERVTQTLRPLTRPGRYQVLYRTVSVDGHVISGRREFTFEPKELPLSSAAPPAPVTSAPVADTGRKAGSSVSLVQVGLAGLVTAVVVAAATALLRGRRARRG